MNPIENSVARDFVGKMTATGLVLAAFLLQGGSALAKDRPQNLGSITIEGAGKINLVGFVPDEAGVEDISRISVRLGGVALLGARVRDLVSCAPGTPALVTILRGKPLENLLDHPNIKIALAPFPQVRADHKAFLTCGEKDANGNRTLELSTETEGNREVVGHARVNVEKNRWEFVTTEMDVFSKDTVAVLYPRQCKVVVNGNEIQYGDDCAQENSSSTPAEGKPLITEEVLRLAEEQSSQAGGQAAE